MIFPKKPQILYAPMLSTFGGGSARGFGKNLGGGAAKTLSDHYAAGTTAGLQDVNFNGNVGGGGKDCPSSDNPNDLSLFQSSANPIGQILFDGVPLGPDCCNKSVINFINYCVVNFGGCF